MFDFNKYIYDNGKSLIGLTSRILCYANSRIENDPLDEDETEFYVELLDELKNYNSNHLLIINYDNPMGYDIEVFEGDDIINERS